MKKTIFFFGLLTSLAACGPSATQEGEFLRGVPEDVVALAAPNQDLKSAVLLEEDGCYWYQHAGPVETTLLPLMSKRGRRICTERQTEAQ